ncbi:hypothetical protein CDAR_266331 [Caerostris darwini]|uniref:Uncharacterized protein n=1 Tax=Caerostris darwini TaxID=1538125 RepID=A0AAV4SDK6_9ARAC|nr:hypothetical protein CDAR_9211 [Caerostris darwini]GIY31044.1 hypothetical protein CDAR_266331 [Caerostris darwini]
MLSVTYRWPSSPNAKSPRIRSLRRYLGGMGGTTPLDIIVSLAIGTPGGAHEDQTIFSLERRIAEFKGNVTLLTARTDLFFSRAGLVLVVCACVDLLKGCSREGRLCWNPGERE